MNARPKFTATIQVELEGFDNDTVVASAHHSAASPWYHWVRLEVDSTTVATFFVSSAEQAEALATRLNGGVK